MEEVGDIYLMDEFTYKYVVKGHPTAISKGLHREAILGYWNITIRRDAFIRRGEQEDVLIKDFQEYLDDYAYQRELQIRSSLAYRLGKFLLRPFSWIKSKCIKSR